MNIAYLYVIPVVALTYLGIKSIVEFSQVSSTILMLLFSACISLVIYFFHTYSKKNTKVSINVFDIIYLITLIMNTISWMVYSKLESCEPYIIAIWLIFFIYLIIRLNISKSLIVKNCMTFLVMVGTISSILFVWQIYHSKMYNTTIEFNPNYGALYLALFLPLCYGLYKSYKSLMSRILIILSSLLIILALAISFCRTSWFGVGISIAIMFIIINRILLESFIKRIKLFFIISVVFTFGVVCYIAMHVYMIKPMSFIGRIFAYHIAINVILKNPVYGVGFGNCTYSHVWWQTQIECCKNATVPFKMASSRMVHSFNDYLETFIENGFLFSIFHIIFWLFLLKIIIDEILYCWYMFGREKNYNIKCVDDSCLIKNMPKQSNAYLRLGLTFFGFVFLVNGSVLSPVAYYSYIFCIQYMYCFTP